MLKHWIECLECASRKGDGNAFEIQELALHHCYLKRKSANIQHFKYLGIDIKYVVLLRVSPQVKEKDRVLVIS